MSVIADPCDQLDHDCRQDNVDHHDEASEEVANGETEEFVHTILLADLLVRVTVGILVHPSLVFLAVAEALEVADKLEGLALLLEQDVVVVLCLSKVL